MWELDSSSDSSNQGVISKSTILLIQPLNRGLTLRVNALLQPIITVGAHCRRQAATLYPKKTNPVFENYGVCMHSEGAKASSLLTRHVLVIDRLVLFHIFHRKFDTSAHIHVQYLNFYHVVHVDIVSHFVHTLARDL